MGVRMNAVTALGITSNPIIGTANKLAARPYCDIWLKWNAEIGAVARPATADVKSSAMTGLMYFHFPLDKKAQT